MLTAERKHAMADLARGVSHDVNNALGAVLPLVQQLQEDLTNGDLDAAAAATTWSQIERSLSRSAGGSSAGCSTSPGASAQNPSEVSLAPRGRRAAQLSSARGSSDRA